MTAVRGLSQRRASFLLLGVIVPRPLHSGQPNTLSSAASHIKNENTRGDIDKLTNEIGHEGTTKHVYSSNSRSKRAPNGTLAISIQRAISQREYLMYVVFHTNIIWFQRAESHMRATKQDITHISCGGLHVGPAIHKQLHAFSVAFLRGKNQRSPATL